MRAQGLAAHHPFGGSAAIRRSAEALFEAFVDDLKVVLGPLR